MPTFSILGGRLYSSTLQAANQRFTGFTPGVCPILLHCAESFRISRHDDFVHGSRQARLKHLLDDSNIGMMHCRQLVMSMNIPIHPEAGTAHGKCMQCKNAAGLLFEFDHAFQPIVDVSMHNIYAHEALVRGPEGQGALSVLSQIDDSNRYAFDQACRVSAIRGAARLGMPSMLSINFMPNAVYRPEACIQTTLTAAREFGFPIDRIIFETTENEKVIDKKFLIEILSEYKRFGFMTAIDDFGAGYAGLDLLADFQPDIIKIDMELVRGIDSNRPRQVIVNSILDMCTLLDIEVIAEGIETYQEYRCLADLGIAYMQGYYFSKPQFRGLGSIDAVTWL